MSEARIDSLSNESNTGGPTLSGITTFSGTNYFVPPVGNTEQRPENPEKGSIRFNTDTKHLEYYRGDTIGWAEIEASNDELNGGTRMVTGGGYSHPDSDYVNYMAYGSIESLGNFVDFGDRTEPTGNGMFGYSSRTRGVFGCGYDTGPNTSTNVIDYITIASTGNALDFGDAAYKVEGACGLSNGVRGVHAYGFQRTDWASKNDLQYSTIASKGNTIDTGIDLSIEHRSSASFSSSTRGIWYGGVHPAARNTISYITITSLGQLIDFGDIPTAYGENNKGASNAVRGVVFAGYNGPASANSNEITYITIASVGNASDFGDATQTVNNGTSGSSPTRVLYAGGSPASNIIEYVQISTTGNAVDFGDLTHQVSGGACVTNGHGGL